jgi:hypothetical protein
MWSFPGVTEPITYFEEVKRAQDEKKERRQADAEEQGKEESETVRADNLDKSVVGEEAPAVSASVASPSRKQEEECAIEEEGGRGARPAIPLELEGNSVTNRRKRKKRKTEVATASPAPAKPTYAPTYKQQASRSSEELEAIRYRPLRFHLRQSSHTRADVFAGKAGTRASCPRALPGPPPFRRTSCSLLVPRPSSGGDSYGRRIIEGRAPPPKQVRDWFHNSLVLTKLAHCNTER